MKKLLSILLCLSLMTVLFAGCGSTAGSQTSAAASSTTEASAEETAAEEEAAAPAAEEPTAETEASVPAEEASAAEEAAEPESTGVPHQYNFPNSENARLDYTNEYTLPLCEETETITWMRNAVNLMGPMGELGIDNFQKFEYMQYLEEITNVNIEFTELNFMTSQEQMNIAFASGDYAAIVSEISYTGGEAGALNDEVIIDLTDYLEEYAPNYYYMIHSNADEYSIFTTDGKVLSFQAPYENFINNQGLVVRSDWLEELGMDVPTTYDEMYDVLTAFKENYTEYPMYMDKNCYVTGMVSGYDVAPYGASGEAANLPFYVVDGEIHCSLIEDGYRDYLTEMHKWFEAGLFNADFTSLEYNPTSNTLTESVNTGELGLWQTSGEGVDNYSVPFTCMAVPTANEDGMDHITSTALTTDSINTCVTSCCDNVELAMRLLDYFYSEDGILLYNYGIEGVDYTIDENGTPQFTDTVLNNEYGVSVANYMRSRCPYAVFSSMMLRYRTADLNSDICNEAWEMWSSNLDGSMAVPANVSMNPEETETLSYYATDICTYAAQTIPQFINGDVSLDEWDSYVAKLQEMNIEECIAAEQSAYDRAVG